MSDQEEHSHYWEYVPFGPMPDQIYSADWNYNKYVMRATVLLQEDSGTGSPGIVDEYQPPADDGDDQDTGDIKSRLQSKLRERLLQLIERVKNRRR